MKYFIDSAVLSDIIKYEYLIDGVTTNPSLVRKSGVGYESLLKEIVHNTSINHISAEVTTNTESEMIEQGESYHKISDRIVIKLPMTEYGIKAAKVLIAQNMRVNITLCFSVTQALIAHNIGAHYVSPFIGRIDDIYYRWR